MYLWSAQKHLFGLPWPPSFIISGMGVLLLLKWYWSKNLPCITFNMKKELCIPEAENKLISPSHIETTFKIWQENLFSSTLTATEKWLHSDTNVLYRLSKQWRFYIEKKIKSNPVSRYFATICILRKGNEKKKNQKQITIFQSAEVKFSILHPWRMKV